MLEAKKQFRRVNGHAHLQDLRNALDKTTGCQREPVAKVTVTAPNYNEQQEGAAA